jgi:hypothetical protein
MGRRRPPGTRRRTPRLPPAPRRSGRRPGWGSESPRQLLKLQVRGMWPRVDPATWRGQVRPRVRRCLERRSPGSSSRPWNAATGRPSSSYGSPELATRPGRRQPAGKASDSLLALPGAVGLLTVATWRRFRPDALTFLASGATLTAHSSLVTHDDRVCESRHAGQSAASGTDRHKVPTAPGVGVSVPRRPADAGRCGCRSGSTLRRGGHRRRSGRC